MGKVCALYVVLANYAVYIYRERKREREKDVRTFLILKEKNVRIGKRRIRVCVWHNTAQHRSHLIRWNTSEVEHHWDRTEPRFRWMVAVGGLLRSLSYYIGFFLLHETLSLSRIHHFVMGKNHKYGNWVTHLEKYGNVLKINFHMGIWDF